MSQYKNPLIAVFKREISRILRNPAYRFLLFGGPAIAILTMFFVFHKGTVRNIPIAVVDQDQSVLSMQIGNAIDASPDVTVGVKSKDLFYAKSVMECGGVEAIVVLPSQMEKSIYGNREQAIPVYINGTNILKAGIVQRSVLTTLKTYSAGIELNKLQLSGMNRSQAMGRMMPVKVEKHVLFNPYTNYSYFLNSAMLYVMLYLFVFLSSIYTLGNELKRGTGQELLACSNNSVRLAFLGKMGTYTLIFCGFAMVIDFILYKVEGMPMNGNFSIIFIGQFVTIITYQLMGLIFVGVTKNLRLALSLGSAYSMMGITFSGLTYPALAMPKIAQAFRMLFPFTWWEQIMITQSLRGAPIKVSLPYVYYILIFQIISICFFPTYKRLLSDPKYWGKA